MQIHYALLRFVTECNILDIAFALDIAQAQTDWTGVKNFIKQFITQYLRVAPDAVRVSVVTYDSRSATVQFNLTKYSDESQVKYAIDQIPFVSSGTADVTYALRSLAQDVFKVRKLNDKFFKLVTQLSTNWTDHVAN